MYSPVRLKLLNFGSHKETDYKFSKNQTTLIFGVNETDDGQDSNGSGKSYLIEGFVFAITGNPFRKVNTSELIFNGEKEAVIELELENKITKEVFIITRKIKAKGASELVISINGKVDENIVSVNDGNNLILDKIGLSKEDICNYYMISKEKYVSFFSSSDRDVKELINRISKADIIDGVELEVQKDIDKESTVLSGLEKELIKIEAKIDNLIEQKNNAEKNREERENQIKEYEVKIEDNKSNIVKFKTQLSHYLKEVEVGKKDLLEYEKHRESYVSKIDLYQSDIKEFRGALNESKQTLREFEEISSSLEKALLSSVECPKCEHEFSFKDKSIDIAETKENLKDAREGIEECNEEIKSINSDIEKIQKELNKYQTEYDEFESKIRSIQRNIKNNELEVDSFKRKIELCEKENVRYLEVIKEINDNLEDSDIEKSIKELEKSKKSKEIEIEESVTKINDLETWKNRFKRFKGFLANKSLDLINGHANKYLDLLKSNVRLSIEGYKELKSGDLREKITPKILKNGEDVGSFGKLSGGEKARADVAVILAIQKMINSSSEFGGLNLIILDEVLESLDGSGLHSLVNALSNLEQNVMLITHGKVTDNYPNTVVVRKINGVSTIES